MLLDRPLTKLADEMRIVAELHPFDVDAPPHPAFGVPLVSEKCFRQFTDGNRSLVIGFSLNRQLISGTKTEVWHLSAAMDDGAAEVESELWKELILAFFGHTKGLLLMPTGTFPGNMGRVRQASKLKVNAATQN